MADFHLIGRGKSGQGAEQDGSLVQRHQQAFNNTVDSSKSTFTTSQYERKQRRLRRSADLIEAVRQIDVQTDPVMRQAIIDWVADAYEKRGGGRLIGLFSKCYLGHPYCDHRMDITGSIIEHYKLGEPVPPMYAQARTLAASGAYAFIEVYADGTAVPVRPDGTATC